MRRDHVVMNVPTRQHFGERVTDELADAQLPLRGACALFCAAGGHGK
jgi:hypothetical protein